MSEREVAASLLRVEKASLPKLRAAVQVPSDRTALAVATSGHSTAQILTTIRHEADDVEARVYTAVVDARKAAREDSRKKQAAAVLALLLLGRKKGVAVDIPAVLHPGAHFFSSSEAVAFDAAQSASVARSLASSWSAVTMAKVQEWRVAAKRAATSATQGSASKASQAATHGMPPGGPYRSPGVRAEVADTGALAKDIRKAPQVLEPKIVRANVTEVATAHNDEAHRFYEALPPAVKAAVELQWSAILDLRTCPVCERLDGTISVGGQFPDGPPPLHAHCRCVIYPVRRKP